MDWINSNISKSVDMEMDTLKTLLNIVSQLDKKQATRMLVYCFKYVEDAEPEMAGIKIPDSLLKECKDILKMSAGKGFKI